MMSLLLLISVISVFCAPTCFYAGMPFAASVMAIIGGVSFTIWAFSLAKKYADWVEKDSNGFNPFLGF